MQQSPQTFLFRLLRSLQMLSGWFLLYLVIGGLVGFAITRPYTSAPSCLPFNSAFGVLESNCPVRAVNAFWSVTIGWPRFMMVFPAVAIALFRAAASTGGEVWDGAIWLLYSTPLFLLTLAGILYWWKRHWALGAIIGTMIVLQVVALGLKM